MAQSECQCPCFCDPTVSRTFEQSGARYNDRSAFANNLQQDSVVQMQNMFQAQAQNALEQTPATTLMGLMQSLTALINQPGAGGVMSTVDKLLVHQQQSAADSAKWISVASQHKLNERMLHTARRHDAQVDAMLNVKYDECGQPDAYQPPQPDDDMNMPTLINCSFNGDQAVKQITEAIRDEDGTPLPPEKPAGSKWLKWLFGILAAVSLGALLIMLSYNLFGGERYEIVAIPYDPNA